MGGFAITTTDPQPNLEIVTCHVNIWALKSLTWNPVFYYDVGLELRGLHDGETTLRMYLPFESERAEDLRHVFNDQETAGLVFGEQVGLNGDQLTFQSRAPLTAHSVEKKIVKVAAESGHTQTVYDVTLKREFDAVTSYYVRMRFVAKSLRGLWQIKRSLFMSNGATADLRFLDMRDWFKTDDHHPERERIRPIQRLQVFVIAPAAFQLRAANPSLKYMRMLEPRSWTHYLGRVPSKTRGDKYLIYYWDSKRRNGQAEACEAGNTEITTLEPARLFLDISRDFGYMLPWNLVRIGAVVFLLMIVPYDAVRNQLFYFVPHAWRELLAALLGVGIVTAIVKGCAFATKLPNAVVWFRDLYRRFEDRWFRSER